MLFRSLMADIRKWAAPLVRNVIASMYNNAMKKDPRAYKDRENFLKVIAEWHEKIGVQHDVGENLADILLGKYDDKTITIEASEV